MNSELLKKAGAVLQERFILVWDGTENTDAPAAVQFADAHLAALFLFPVQCSILERTLRDQVCDSGSDIKS